MRLMKACVHKIYLKIKNKNFQFFFCLLCDQRRSMQEKICTHMNTTIFSPQKGFTWTIGLWSAFVTWCSGRMPREWIPPFYSKSNCYIFAHTQFTNIFLLKFSIPIMRLHTRKSSDDVIISIFSRSERSSADQPSSKKKRW